MSAITEAWLPEQIVSQPEVSPWVIGITVSMAAFLEVLDTSIANVALPYIAGNLGASYDDSTWVLTSYLAANAIVLPISGWLAEAHWPQALFPRFPGRLHSQLAAVWPGAKPAHAASISGCARGGRRRPATDGAGHPQ